MDGVLVLGANNYHIEAWKRAFQEHNIKLHMVGLEEYGRLEGMKGEEIQELILKKNNIVIQSELANKIYQRKKEIFKEIDDPFTPEETKLLLHDLSKMGLKLAVASGNNRTVIDNFLRKSNLTDIFHYTVTGDEVKNGKPDPEVFLKALERLKLSKDEVIIVENAPLGIQAAKAAGIFTVAITSTLPIESLIGADKIITHLSEIKEILQMLS